jgi:hypothetical protein
LRPLSPSSPLRPETPGRPSSPDRPRGPMAPVIQKFYYILFSLIYHMLKMKTLSNCVRYLLFFIRFPVYTRIIMPLHLQWKKCFYKRGSLSRGEGEDGERGLNGLPGPSGQPGLDGRKGK